MVQKVNLKMFAMTEVPVGWKIGHSDDLLDLWAPLYMIILNSLQNVLMLCGKITFGLSENFTGKDLNDWYYTTLGEHFVMLNPAA